jgi:hypothetical protein
MSEATAISKSPDALPLTSCCGFQSGDAFRTNLMHDAAQFLDPRAQPSQLFLVDLVMFGLCRAPNYAEQAWDAPEFQQLCCHRLGIVFGIRLETIDASQSQ